MQRPWIKDAILTKAQLQSSGFHKANLQGANLYEANLQKAVLSEVNLEEANCCAAQLQQAKLTKTNLQKAFLNADELHGTNLWQVINIEQQQLEVAFGDSETKLLDKMQRPNTWIEKTK